MKTLKDTILEGLFGGSKHKAPKDKCFKDLKVGDLIYIYDKHTARDVILSYTIVKIDKDEDDGEVRMWHDTYSHRQMYIELTDEERTKQIGWFSDTYIFAVYPEFIYDKGVSKNLKVQHVL